MNKGRYDYKEQYERFKLIVNMIGVVLALTNLYFEHRTLDLIFFFLIFELHFEILDLCFQRGSTSSLFLVVGGLLLTTSHQRLKIFLQVSILLNQQGGYL